MDIAEKLAKIAENEQKVYDSGKAKAFSEVEAVNSELEQILYGKDTGGKGFYDEFWDAYQNNGKRNNYQYAFANEGWNDTTFKPKYDIVLHKGYTASNMFTICGITDISAALERQGVKLDTSKCGYFSGMFQNSKSVTRIPVIDFSSAHEYANSLGYVFYGCTAEAIDKIIINEQTVFVNASSFNSCANLKNVIFEGTLGQNGLNLQWSKQLSRASITSVINALSSTTSGLTVTLSLAAVQKAFETSEGANDGNNSDEWNTLIATKNNWTISLV